MSEANDQQRLVEALKQPAAFGLGHDTVVEFHETHISYVFLAGKFAYKIKKAIRTPFLDYSTLVLRKRDCELELKLNQRYAAELYLDVVSIACEVQRDGQHYVVGGDGAAVEYAVRMHRFASGSLLGEQLAQGHVTVAEIRALAITISRFHQSAKVTCGELADDWYGFLVENTQQLFESLQPIAGDNTAIIDRLRAWSQQFLQSHRSLFEARGMQGCIRECHGDLHTENVVKIAGRYLPFDGIEFSERLRSIDVLSDVAFLAMDLKSRNHSALANLLLGTYLEHTGDYEQVELLRWYQFYRCLVRAMVDAMRFNQSADQPEQQRTEADNCCRHLQLADRLIQPDSVGLWITYGLSGSGKSTVSERYMMAEHAIRLRSDVERKRMHGLQTNDRPTAELKHRLYSQETSTRVYGRLLVLARQMLTAGYSVVVDATFLRRSQRQPFIALANELNLPWQILYCTADAATLQQRLRARAAKNDDPSDADLAVLEQQQQCIEGEDRLSKEELLHTVTFSA